jgi:hypothetical protein
VMKVGFGPGALCDTNMWSARTSLEVCAILLLMSTYTEETLAAWLAQYALSRRSH